MRMSVILAKSLLNDHGAAVHSASVHALNDGSSGARYINVGITASAPCFMSSIDPTHYQGQFVA